MNNKFTVIIPTRERASTLKFCIETCLNQSYQNLEILIADNYSQDNTKQIVDSFRDSRIKYINSGSRLSMSKNWEFALNHVDKKGYVCFIGDDDGLLPDCINEADRLVKINNSPDCLFWYNKIPWFFWGGQFGGCSDDNTLHYRKSISFLPKKYDEKILALAAMKSSYDIFPTIYHGFISMNLVQKIKEKSKNNHFFHSSIPDVYSVFPICTFSSSIIQLSKPLTINGVSNNSTGGSTLYTSTNQKTEKQFFQEPNIPFNKLLNIEDGENITKYLDRLIADCFLNFLDNVDSIHQKNKENLQELTLISLLQKLKRKNSKELSNYRIKLEESLSKKWTGLNNPFLKKYNTSRYFTYRYSLSLNLKDKNVNTIYDAVNIYNTIEIPRRTIIKNYLANYFKLFLQVLKRLLNVL